MTQQHDAPEGGAAQPVAWRAWSGGGRAWFLFPERLTTDADLTRWEPLYPGPPAPSGLVDAVRAYLAAVDENDGFYSRNHTSHAAGITLKAKLMSTRAALDAALSGQQGGAVPAIPDCASSEADLRTTPQACMVWYYAAALDAISQKDVTRATACIDRMMAAFGRLAKQPAVPAGDLRPGLEEAVEIVRGAHHTTESPDESGIRIQIINDLNARLAEQPAPAGTGDADRVEGLRPGIEKALEIVEAERETVSVSSSAYQRLWSVRNALRDVLDGASGQGEG